MTENGKIVMRRWREVLFVVLLASVIIPTLPRLLQRVRRGYELQPLSMRARREAVLGDFYRGVEELRSRVSASQPLALIRVQDSSDVLFINYYLYPQPTRSYWNRSIYALSDPKTRPNLIVRAGGGAPQIVTYAQLRDFELRKSTVVRGMPLPAETRTAFAIPIVTSVDGPDAYTIEGALASDGRAEVTLTLQPPGISKKLTIEGKRSFYDLVYQCFGRLEFADWVQVSSDRPIRAAFWLVNRAAKTAAPIRLIEGPLRKPAAFPADPNADLWLLNFDDRFTPVRVGSTDMFVPPRTLLRIRSTGAVRGPVYAFLSAKQPGGGTRFTWPEDLQ
jgi:hypothetical protein